RGVQQGKDEGGGGGSDQGARRQAGPRHGPLPARHGLLQPEQEGGRQGALREVPSARTQRERGRDGEGAPPALEVTAAAKARDRSHQAALSMGMTTGRCSVAL